jgi:protease-4
MSRTSLLLSCALCAPCVAMTACGNPDSPAKRKSELRVVHLDALAHESPESGGFGQEKKTHRELLDQLHGFVEDDAVKGLLLHVGELRGAFARARDVRDALAAVRRAGKPVHCYVETTDNLGYGLAAASCDRITLSPAGAIDLVGVAAQTVYAKRALDALGVGADVVQVGAYKGAADAVTEETMPQTVRENLSAMLDDLQSDLVGLVAARKALAPAAAQVLIDGGPYTSERALAAGLVDGVGFDDEARARAKQAAKSEHVTDDSQRERDEFELSDLLDALFEEKDEQASGERVVLAHLDGTIMMGNERSSGSAHARSFVAAMRRFADDEGVKAVVLRIDSPGGSVLASDAMWHAVRRVAKRKPVIASLGDMAASGGYYVAAAATEVMARDESIVGSIGVVGGKLVAHQLAERVGVRFERLSRGRHAAWTSPTQPFSDEERALFQRSLHAAYDRFLARIVEGRKLPLERIQPLAEGRIMTGRRARQGGLVDSEGGLREALARARKQAKLGEDVEVQVWPHRPSFFEALQGMTLQGRSVGSALSEAALSELELPGVSLRGLPELLLAGEAGQAAAVLPFGLTLR